MVQRGGVSWGVMPVLTIVCNRVPAGPGAPHTPCWMQCTPTCLGAGLGRLPDHNPANTERCNGQRPYITLFMCSARSARGGGGRLPRPVSCASGSPRAQHPRQSTSTNCTPLQHNPSLPASLEPVDGVAQSSAFTSCPPPSTRACVPVPAPATLTHTLAEALNYSHKLPLTK